MAVTDQEIQDFLQKTRAFLADLPLQQQEEAMGELKDALKRYGEASPKESFYKTKVALGGPRGAANMFRLRHGLPLYAGAGSSVRKAILITVGLAVVFFISVLGILWWKFTPLLNIEQDRVQVLGGLIDIDGQLGQFKVGDSYEFSDSLFKNVFEGSYEVTDLVEDVLIEFDRGQMEISYAEGSKIVWNCKVSSEPSDGFMKHEKELVTVSFKNVGGVDCEIKIPERLKATVSGDAGKIDLVAPANDTFVQLGNGMVSVEPDSELKYRFDLKIGQGVIDPKLDALSHEGGIEIKVDLGNGQIQQK